MNYIKTFLGDSFDKNTGELKMDKIISKENLNILIMGQSGVGKSTLVNAIFGDDIAKTGEGEPVTQGIERFEIKEKGLVLWDTKGIEAKAYRETIESIKSEIDKTINSLDKKQAPHVAWLCIKEASARIEDREKDLIKITKEFGIPTIVIFTDTQFEKGDEFVKEAKRILDSEYSSFIRNRYVRVNSKEFSFMGVKIEKQGLDDLIDLTSGCLSEAEENIRRNFERVQRVNNKKRLKAMQEEATTIVNLASAAAGAAGASPIPVADAPIIAAIQSGMIYKLNNTFDISLESTTCTTLLAELLGVTALATVGKSIVANVLKFIPVAGTFIGGAISGTTAAALTKSFGEAYIAVLTHYYDEQSGEVKLPKEMNVILNMFKQYFPPKK